MHFLANSNYYTNNYAKNNTSTHMTNTTTTNLFTSINYLHFPTHCMKHN